VCSSDLQLQESKEFSEKIIREMKDGFSLINDKSVQVDVNDALCQMTGFSRDELIDKQPPYPYWPEEEYDSIQEAFQRTLRHEFDDYELVFKKKNGERFPVIVSPYFIKNANGGIGYYVATVKDITERKKMTEVVRLEAERLKSLVSIVQYEPESIQQLLDFALDEAIQLTKSKIGYIYFYDDIKKEFTLNTWSKDVMNECSIMNPQMVYQLHNTGIWGEAVRQAKPVMINDFQADNPLKKGYPEGHSILFKYLTIPIFYQKKIVAVLGVANKETDYNESDLQQLILLMDSVWKAVLRKRTEEELKKQIHQRVDYTRAMVHELKTPLTSLQIASDILGEIAMENPYLDVSNNINRSVKYLTRRVDELLDIAKGEIGLLKLRYHRVNLENMCREVQEELIPIASKKGVELECLKKIDITFAKMDDERILQVIFNLVDNALKFTPRGGKVILAVENDENNLYFSVRDSGCGMTKEKQENLFRKNYDYTGVSQRYSGLGVGLVLSKMLIELHGGCIRVESECSKGSLFTFTIPVHGYKQSESSLQKDMPVKE
jgi:PAS domain S-box-containing protein